MIDLINVIPPVWEGATWKNDFKAAVSDYLRRSNEEIDEASLYEWISAAITGTPGLVLVVALKDGVFAGYGLLRAEAGNPMTGPILHVWQLYAKPGVCTLRELWRAAEPLIVRHGRRTGTKRMTMTTRRFGRAYDRLLRPFGMKPYSMTYQAEIPQFTAEEILEQLRRRNNEARRKRRRRKKAAAVPICTN
jgi:hypothetical protein